MLPASRVVALLSELMTEPKSSKLVLISTRKLLSCGAAGGHRIEQRVDSHTHTHTLAF